jgi:CyaY protein
MSKRLNDAEFKEKAEWTILALEASFAELAEEREMDVEVEGGVLIVTFEEGTPGKFIVSPNSSAGQLWVSARSASYKFDWSEEEDEFVLVGTVEPIHEVMRRLTKEQLGGTTFN